MTVSPSLGDYNLSRSDPNLLNHLLLLLIISYWWSFSRLTRIKTELGSCKIWIFDQHSYTIMQYFNTIKK